ncbi:MAG: 50S ribosomal protein L11 methyltransferase [Anaerolineae bacterium]|nr:50S ribosomal protein L11 methyltransferase [Anaerolineae bacterium]
MRWIEVAMEVDGEAAEAVAEVLNRFGHQGVSIEQAGFYIETWEDEVPKPDRLVVRAYFPDDERAENEKQQIVEALGHMNMMYPMPTPTFNFVNDEDWAEAWKTNYKPIHLGRHILIRPLWITVPSDPEDVVIALDPGMAFGTGTHPSTQLVLEAAEDLVAAQPGARILDLGCGSGILAIGAIKFGASHALAIDTDPMSVRVTEENAEANGTLAAMTIREGSLDSLLNPNTGAALEEFDIALVNILAKVIIMMCGQGLGKIVKVGGVGVFGGIIEEQADEVEAALRSTGLTPYKRRLSGDWVVIEARRV